MTSLSLFLVNLLLSVSAVSSSALPSPLNLISNSLSLPDFSQSKDTNNTSLQNLASPVLSYSPDCSIYYGGDLNRASCVNALAKVSQVTTPLTFGERDTGNWNVVLPRRYLSDDGKCAIDIKVDPNGAQRDVSNYLQMTNAASAVLDDCVGTRLPNTGGVVEELGVKYRSLSVEMLRYFPIVKCHHGLPAVPPSYVSCKEILDNMKWSETMTNFGNLGQAGVQVQLPYFVASGDGQCKMMLFSNLPIGIIPPVATATWASVWSGAVAVNEMCVRMGKGGNARPTSLHGNLIMFFFGPGSSPSPEMLSSLNISTSDLTMLSAYNTTLPNSGRMSSVTNA